MTITDYSRCDELGISHLNHHIDGMDSSNHLYLIRVDGIDTDERMDIFNRGLCFPSDNKMTPDEQDKIIEVVRSCFE